MLKYLAFLLVFLSSCAFQQNEDPKVSVVIKNATDQDMVIRAGNGILSTAVRLKAGESWSGWIDRRLLFSSAFIAVEKPAR